MVRLTGAGGFIGTNLTFYLEEHNITFSAILRQQLDSNNYLLGNTDSVIHLAGKAHDLKSTNNPAEYYKINFELTKALYDAFLRSDSKKFIFISTVKAVAAKTEQRMLTEDVECRPLSSHGKSKLLAEQYILSRPLPEGKSFYILRPCMIHGPVNKGNLNLLYQFVSKGLPYPLAAFENKRSFLSIENLCFVIKELIQRDDIPSGVYHVADDEALSTSQVVQLLSQSLDRPAKLWTIPAKLIRFIAKCGDSLKLPLNTERLGKLTENYVVSNAKIKEALGKDLPVGAREGILKTAESFKHKS